MTHTYKKENTQKKQQTQKPQKNTTTEATNRVLPKKGFPNSYAPQPQKRGNLFDRHLFSIRFTKYDQCNFF